MAAAVVPLTEPEPYQDIDGKACRRFAAAFLERCIRDALMDFNRTSNVHAWLAGHFCFRADRGGGASPPRMAFSIAARVS